MTAIVRSAAAGLALCAHVMCAQAAELKFTCTHALKAVSLELIPLFERATGHKVAMRFDVVGGVKRQIEAGDVFDVACLNPAMIEDLAKQGKLAAELSANIARAGMGLAVRAGTPKPDIGSVDAVKRTLLAAKSIAYSQEGQSGAYFRSMIERLGIAEQLRDKLKPTRPGQATAAVTSGEAEMLVVVTSSIVADPGVDLVGLLPQELQSYSTFALGVSASTKESEAAQALVRFLTSSEAAPVIKAKGMEPTYK
jgi:molybdate transport system substrate-binding protein